MLIGQQKSDQRFSDTAENNVAIRDLRNIPQFFRDATIFSVLPSNQSYRPLVSTLLAIDYRLGNGLQPFWFHLSVFILFAALTLALALHFPLARNNLEYARSMLQKSRS